ncbi:MAG: bifunctional glutamate N-acetyltransferase/amino-acid acetyltransferase ArgJ [Deltaproteobacteria bacterium]|nr:bifunctional glutamate N-acetyltransferase/amino-acid acetyltransferase ArgJ [Deltaproteobacteria bacterium]
MPVISKKKIKIGRLKPVPGFTACGMSCGIKKNGKKDLALIVSDAPAAVAGVFTTNKVKAAPVMLSIARVKKGWTRGVVINSGNANACTGRRGDKDAMAMTAAVEKALGLKTGEMLAASTGVIGVPLPVKKIEAASDALASRLRNNGLAEVSEAILTTDAFPKTAFLSVNIHGVKISIAGIAKGAGMICPDMATLLAFFMTDAAIKPAALRRALKEAVDVSFNGISVDNDMSTNDTALAFASGASNPKEIKAGTPDFRRFTSLLTEVAQRLARMIVMDGEGATRFITLEVCGAASRKDAASAAKTVASSMLVKTAFFGGDPNWGRILAALGRAGIKMKEDRVDVFFNGVQVVKRGLDTGKEKKAARAVNPAEVLVRIGLNMGDFSTVHWTSDLSYEYVKINSAYRT